MVIHSFVEKLSNIILLQEKDIQEVKRAAKKFRGLYNSQAYDDVVVRIHGDEKLPGKRRAKLYIDLCNKWNCRIGGSVREETLKIIGRVESLAWKIDKNIEQIEYSDYSEIIRPVDVLSDIKGIGITATSKILSLAKPELYVMIDQAICYELGFANNSVGYFRYLIQMRDVARRLRQLSREAGINNLEKYLKPKDRTWEAPLAIYLDEWNWMKITYERR